MREPGRKRMPRIVAHCALLGCGAKRIGDALGSALVVGCKRNAEMGVVEDFPG